MYTINTSENNNLHYVVLKGKTAEAKICLSRGSALESLMLNNKTLIEDLEPLTYQDTYASSILFPFANRIKDGAYTYNEQKFELDCNETGNNNALHGLVYNKLFSVESSDVSEQGATVVLKYTETQKAKGFPYMYTVVLTYTLRDTDFSLNVTIENNDTQSFPYTLGWHPYFVCDNLAKSSLSFNSSKTYQFDDRMITKGEDLAKVAMPFEIKNQQLDNCYALNDGEIVFDTPGYKMKLTSSAEENYFQMYTPPRANTIALEPVTGISDSFNNKIGLQTLDAGMTADVNWHIELQ